MSQINNHQFLVVLYKMSLLESPTIQTIVDYFSRKDNSCNNQFELIIWDNSPISGEQQLAALQHLLSLKISFKHTPENRSLSQIYNEVASKLAEDKYLTLLDQDTELPSTYFEELKMAQRDKWPLILPKVECQGLLVSPGKRFFARGIRLKEISSGMINSKNLLAINSGMSVLGKVFRVIKYDERLRFYGTDVYFMKKFENYFDHAFILNATLSHSLAEMDEKSNDWHIAHAQEKQKTFALIFSEGLAEMFFLQIYLVLIRLKYKIRLLITRIFTLHFKLRSKNEKFPSNDR